MLTRLTLILLLLLPWADDPRKQGRRGNAYYEGGQYQEAANAYRAGLAALEDEPQGRTHYALLNNLGAALHRMGDFEQARSSFEQGLSLSGSDADFARTAYNAGGNAYARQRLDEALDFYKRALLADPENEDAKYNYEFVKRRMDEQQQQQQSGGDQSNEDQQQQDDQNGSGQNNEQQQDDEQQQNDAPQQEEQQNQGSQDPQQQEEQEGGAQQQPQQQAPAPDPNELSREQAERILQALEDDEEKLLRQVQKLKTRPRQVEKDW